MQLWFLPTAPPNQTDLEPCYLLKGFGYYMLILWIFGTLLNGSLLYVLSQNKTFHSSSTNVFILGLIFADFLGAFAEIPLPALSLVSCRWIFGNIGCLFEAMITYFAGCSNMYILCLISIDRYIVISKCFASNALTVKRAYFLLGLAYFLSFSWTLMPIFGWSQYDYEGLGVSCSIKWEDHSFNVVSYNMAILIFVYFLPLMIIVVTNIKIYGIIRQRCRYSANNLNEQCIRRKFIMERRVLHTISLIIVGFFMAWTPYAVAVCVRVFLDAENFPPILSTVPSLFAKTAVVWNPLIYVLRNGNFRRLR